MKPLPTSLLNRRSFLLSTGALSASLVSAAPAGAQETGKEAENEEEMVSPPEDLMREHGVLKRVILIYREYLRRNIANEELPPEQLMDAATIIRTFIEDYHERLEENYLFPRFEKANKLVDLVTVLKTQHQRGRALTDQVLQFAKPQELADTDNRLTVMASLDSFIQMYEPHEAREDTVLFPALRSIVSPHEFGALGETFEDEEHKLFGADGFESMVDRVATIERALGIYDLSQFTPQVPGQA